MSDVYPFLAVKDVDAAVLLYAQAFGAIEEGERVRAPDGAQVAVLSIAGHRVGVATEAPELGTPSPETLGATTVRISLDVDIPTRSQPRRSLPARARCSRSPTSPTGCAKDA